MKHRLELGMFPLHASTHQFFFICDANETKGKSFKRETTPSVPSLLPYLCQYLCVSAAFRAEFCCSLSPWHSLLAHSPGPSCGMLYSARPMEEGHPGTREERKRANSHMLTHPPTHANTYARTNTAVGSRHDPLAGVQIKDCVGRPAFRLNEVTK